MVRTTTSGLALAMMMGAAAIAAEPASQPAAAELRPILSAEQKRAAAVQLIDGFVEHVRGAEAFPAEARRAVVDGWKEHRADTDPEEFLTAGLAILSEPFRQAISAMEEERYAEADAALTKLTKHDDPYLSLHAQGLLARSLVEQERLEEAEEILVPLAAREKDLIERSFLEPEVDFLLGYTQLSNLHYDEALASLQAFEQQHPDAPDRFRLPARQMLQELAARQPEGLGEVSDLMVYSSRRLANGQPGKPVQISQDRAVMLLTKLIEEAESREQQQKNQNQGKKDCKDCEGKGCKKCGGGSPKGFWQSNRPANESALPGGPGQIGNLDRAPNARPGDEWGKMRPEDREKILQSLRRTFPSRYRDLVEQYYKQLAREK